MATETRGVPQATRAGLEAAGCAVFGGHVQLPARHTRHVPLRRIQAKARARHPTRARSVRAVPGRAARGAGLESQGRGREPPRGLTERARGGGGEPRRRGDLAGDGPSV